MGGDVGSETTCDLSGKEVKSGFDFYTFRWWMRFIGHWAEVRTIKDQGGAINQCIFSNNLGLQAFRFLMIFLIILKKGSLSSNQLFASLKCLLFSPTGNKSAIGFPFFVITISSFPFLHFSHLRF